MSMPLELNLTQARLCPNTSNDSTPSLVLTSPLSSRRNSIDAPSHHLSPQFPVTGATKTLCNRGAAILSIHLTEPVLYLTGFEASEYVDRSPAMLRGSLILKLLKPSKVKSITLVFKGSARTEWPEGIPPRKVEFFEEKDLMTHTWPFFNAQFSNSESSHGADATRFLDSQRLSTDLSRSSMDSVSSLALSDTQSSRSATPVGSPNLLAVNNGNPHFGIPYGQSRSFSKEDKTVTQSRGYRLFPAGEYVYNFELPLDSILPESIEADMGSVRYELEATVERSRAFKSNLCGKTEVLLVRNPAEQNLEIHEPISISRTWEDQLHYEILIAGKAFPLNGVIPIAFKFTPLAKVRLHRIKIFLSENIEYYCRDKKVHRLEPMRKLLLYEKQAQKSGEVSPRAGIVRGNSYVAAGAASAGPAASGTGISVSGSRPPVAVPLGRLPGLGRPTVSRQPTAKEEISANSLLGNLEGGDASGVSTEFEVEIPLPGCQVVKTPLDSRNKNSPQIPVRFHHGTIWPNINVHHWIKIVLRISKVDETSENKSKRRHFEISIDSPIHLLSCRSQANTYLPAYTLPTSIPLSGADLSECPCMRVKNALLTVPSANLPTQSSPLHTHRPMHLMRQPSINPPSFDDDVAPPPLLTPPPNYDDLTPRIAVRDGYFEDSVESGENSEEIDEIDAAEGVDEVAVADEINGIDEVERRSVFASSEFAETESMMEGSEVEEGDIVDMVGLEDLSLNVRQSSPIIRRSVDIGIYAS